MVDPNRQSVAERLTSAAKGAISNGLQQAMQYGKEVATGKKLMEGLSQNDGAFQGWMAHGSTELANMLLHGHPAPVYARSLSPADNEGQPSAEPVQDNEPPAIAPTKQNDVGVHGPKKEASSLEHFQSSVGKICQSTEPSHQSPEVQRQVSR